MKREILRNMFLLSLVTVILTSLSTCGVLYNHQLGAMKQQIKSETGYIATILSSGSNDTSTKPQEIGTAYRMTIIMADGTVLYDNRSDPGKMDNHRNRPEVDAAIRYGSGESVRQSDTIGEQTCYYALRLANGSILRLAFTTETVYSVFLELLPYIFIVSCVVFGIAMIMAISQSQNLVAPINSINLEEPMENNVYPELSPLLVRIHRLRQYINKQIKEAKENQKQFSAITANMEEGIIILDKKGSILSLNKSAVRLLGTVDADYVNMHILNLNRSIELQKIVEAVLSGSASQNVITFKERSIRVWANPVFRDGDIDGVILILLDITESFHAENFRREFSANVSHELKTPLTVISGYAELLQNNLVKPEDVSSFADKIYNEAKRLIKLVDDIITLSRLDEDDMHLAAGNVDLFEIAQSVSDRLSVVAKQKGVTLTISGEPVKIPGIPRLLDEMVYNLCDNAIQYNKENGSVSVTVSENGGKAILLVKDTGIGIPEEHKDRIFERFYRVDGSHSKETGGTGLGLSIVKHVARYHHAEIRLESALGKGTTITVSFPLQASSQNV